MTVLALVTVGVLSFLMGWLFGADADAFDEDDDDQGEIQIGTRHREYPRVRFYTGGRTGVELRRQLFGGQR
jgi:hypothetical protein